MASLNAGHGAVVAGSGVGVDELVGASITIVEVANLILEEGACGEAVAEDAVGNYVVGEYLGVIVCEHHAILHLAACCDVLADKAVGVAIRALWRIPSRIAAASPVVGDAVVNEHGTHESLGGREITNAVSYPAVEDAEVLSLEVGIALDIAVNHTLADGDVLHIGIGNVVVEATACNDYAGVRCARVVGVVGEGEIAIEADALKVEVVHALEVLRQQLDATGDVGALCVGGGVILKGYAIDADGFAPLHDAECT